jgi:hypothetical protein
VLPPPAPLEIRRFSGPGRTRPVRTAAGPAPAAAAVDLEGSALVAGERIEITGDLRPGAVVFARGAGDGSYEAFLVVDDPLDRGHVLELTADRDGKPVARLRESPDRPGRRLEPALMVRVY